MKKAYCCHVLDSSLYSSQNPCDFCNKSNCLFSQAYEECYICKVGEQWCFLILCPQSAQQCDWDGFACSHGRGKWSKQWIPDISCLQLMWGLCKTAGSSLKPSQCFLFHAVLGWLVQGSPSAVLLHTPSWSTGHPAASNLGGHSIASSETRILVVFSKWVGPCICFLHLLLCSGIKRPPVLDLRKQHRGSLTIHMKHCLSARANY